MKSKSSLCFVIGLMLCTSFSFSQNDPVVWQKQPYEVDGKVANWPAITMDEKSGYTYGISVDSAYVYLSVKIGGLQLQNQIFLAGLTCWIDKKRKKGIRFPIGVPEEQRPRDPNVFEDYLYDLQDGKYQRVKELFSLELLGFYGGKELTWGEAKNEGGINAAASFDSEGILIYELAIPRTSFDKPEKGIHLSLESGVLGRPRLHAWDAVGISGGSVSNPGRIETEKVRNYQYKLERYRQYTVAKRVKIKKI
ncbi:MAG: hypothetical protein AAF206_13500, partial [Bacteroidota bacterium]